MTLLGAVKPLHVDDPFYYEHATQIAANALDPFGHEVFWRQWPKPGIESLAPPVVTHWWALAIRLFGERPWAWKLWMLPFSVLLAYSLESLFRRYARGLEVSLLCMVLVSPTVLPSLNLMIDVPELALSLAALVIFMRSVDARCAGRAAVAGLVAGLAMQTKYTALLVPWTMLLYALSVNIRRVALWLITVVVAASIFIAWEQWTSWRYGHGQFLWHLQYGFPEKWGMPRMTTSLVMMLGGLAAPTALLGLVGLGCERTVVHAATAALVVLYLLVIAAPVEHLVFALSGLGVAVVMLLVVCRLCWPFRVRRWRSGRWRADRREWFLVAWLMLLVVGYFVLSPFGAARRLLAISVVMTILPGRLASLRRRAHPGGAIWPAVAASTLLGMLYYTVDLTEALALKSGAQAAARKIRQQHRDATIWFVGHWGFQYYAEQARMKPVIPDHTTLRRGDWLVHPLRIHRPYITLIPDAVETVDKLVIEPIVPIGTLPHYYGGETPLAHLDRPLLEVMVYRMTADVEAVTFWSAERVVQWALRHSGGTLQRAAPALARALSSENPETRRWATYCLARIGPAADSAIPALVGMLRDESPDCVQAAGWALAHIQPTALTGALQHDDARVREGAARALGSMGPRARTARRALRRALDDPDEGVRRAAVEALEQIDAVSGPQSP